MTAAVICVYLCVCEYVCWGFKTEGTVFPSDIPLKAWFTACLFWAQDPWTQTHLPKLHIFPPLGLMPALRLGLIQWENTEGVRRPPLL